MANGESSIDKARRQKDLEYAKKREREQRSPFFSGGAAGQGQSAVFDPEMSARIQAFGTDLRNPGITNPNFAFSLRDPSFTPNSSYLNTGPVNPTAPVVPGVFSSGGINPESMFSTATGEPYDSTNVLPPKTSSNYEENLSMGAILNEIAALENPEEELDEEQKTRLNNLYKQKEAMEAKGAKGQFSNELLLQMLPQLFSQPFEQSEADRQYAMEMRQYQDQQQRRAAALEQEKLGRQQAFALIPKLFPDLGLDLSSFGGELDPSLIPALIQMAQLKASKQSQRMAQPVVRFA